MSYQGQRSSFLPLPSLIALSVPTPLDINMASYSRAMPKPISSILQYSIRNHHYLKNKTKFTIKGKTYIICSVSLCLFLNYIYISLCARIRWKIQGKNYLSFFCYFKVIKIKGLASLKQPWIPTRYLFSSCACF